MMVNFLWVNKHWSIGTAMFRYNMIRANAESIFRSLSWTFLLYFSSVRLAFYFSFIIERELSKIVLLFIVFIEAEWIAWVASGSEIMQFTS